MTTMFEEQVRPSTRRPPAHDCEFCSRHGLGETVFVEISSLWFGDELDGPYGPINYCPLCGRKLKAFATLD